jgi:hypothetical protein
MMAPTSILATPDMSSGTIALTWIVLILCVVSVPLLYRRLNRSARYRAFDRWASLLVAGVAVVLAIAKFDGWPMLLLLLCAFVVAVFAVVVGDKQA